MKNLKKVMALVIVLSMVVSMFTVMTASAADFSDVAGTEYEEAVSVLAPMGVIAGYEEDGALLYKPEQVVTRAEMAAFIVRELGLAAAGKADTGFNDVAVDFWGSGAIKIAAKKNIVVGYGDGNFGPDDQVTFEQAVKMLVCALGYEEDAQDNGAWPSGYLAIAKQKELLAGLEDILNTDTTIGCDRGTVALLLYNALDITMQKVTYIDGEPVFFDPDGTMAYKMGYYKFSDVIVNATDKAVVAGKLQDKGYAAIDENGDVYEMLYGENDMDAYLGQKVTLYASYNKKTEEYTIVSVIGNSVKSDVVTLDVADIYGMNGTDLEYYIDRATSSKTSDYTLAKLPADANEGDAVINIVYNNASIKSDDLTDYDAITNSTNGTVTLIDSTKDGVYEKVIIESYKNYQVAEVDVEENLLVLTDDTEVTLDDSRETNRPKFAIANAEGTALALADLAEDDVLSIYSDVYKDTEDYITDADSLKIVACNETVEGKVTSKSSKKVYIDGEAYETDGVLALSDFAIDDEGIFFLDFNGDIAFVDTTAALDNFEFVYDGIKDGRDITLYTMDANGAKKSYGMATKVRVTKENEDGDLETNTYSMNITEQRNDLAADLQIAGSDGLTDEYIVSLKINDNNEITRITVLDGEEEDGSLSHSDKLIGNYSINDETVIFTLPAGEAFDEDNLKAVKYTGLKNNNEYDFKVCDVNAKNNVVNCMIVYTTESDVDTDSSIAVIQSVATTKAEDEDVLVVTMIQDGKVVTKNTKDDAVFFHDSVKYGAYGDSEAIVAGAYAGKIIMYSTDANGAIANVENVYPRANTDWDAETDAPYWLLDQFQLWNGSTSENNRATLILIGGNVEDKNTETKVLNITVDGATVATGYGAARIVVVDTNMPTEENAVRIGSASDIKKGDYVVVRKNQGDVKDIVVYKNFDVAPNFWQPAL